MTKHFLDTNILLYSISTAADEARKADRARQLLDLENGALSIQVLQEFYVQSTRVTRADPISHEAATGLLQSWARFDIQALDAHVFWLALEIRESHGFSYWDSAIISAARAAGCEVVYSEDLQHGQVVLGVRIVNPFV